ncbi:hypothetical protein SAMN05720473_11338 [Fibrobacter sp. UWB15]|uniref:hypothetical protein n=1 Tax=unclassified Fibrobacter TaxID=2634177 RepID=UPI00091E1227|nr:MULTISPECIES: hypothetical protein [unclassified Fibrobacter]PWJ61961.1 hypothetical protein BGW99_11438 [Fibrobacter sp. UWB6]SHG57239.1 hypothetical protein SAMN05720760_11517 [Fibrobacter sp. UWB8]SMG42229.1 hypothetical protein SAMN05720473_11338 [Fibrobacter sp. UWB15]
MKAKSMKAVSSKKRSTPTGSKKKSATSSTKKKPIAKAKRKIGDVSKPKPVARNLRTKDTGLPMNIWIDEGGSYKKGKHAPRIKVQTNKKAKVNKDEFLSIDLDGNVHHEENKKKNDLKGAEIEEAKKYVRANKDLLRQIADQKEELSDDNIKKMKSKYEQEK